MKNKFWSRKVSVFVVVSVIGTQCVFPMNTYALASDSLVAMPLSSYENSLDPTGKILAKALKKVYGNVSPQITGKVYVNGKLSSEKLPAALVPYLDGKTPMVPIEKIAPIFGLTADYNYEWKTLDIDKK